MTNLKNMIFYKMKIGILILSVLLFFTSCEEFLDQKPTDGLVRSEYWNNKEEVLNTLSAAYVKLADLDYTLFLHGEIRGDMINRYSRTNINQIRLMQNNIQSTHPDARWTGFYSTINLCNHVITLAPAVQDRDATFNDYLLNQYVSEAIFIRGLMYFYLVRIFKDVPYITEPSGTDDVEFFVSLTSADDILAAVKDDLLNIRDKIPSEYTAIEETKSRATRAAVNALLADISLWNEEYDECISYIEEIEQTEKYFLLPGEKWFENFDPGFSLENIFEIYYNASQGQSNSLYRNTYQQGYYAASDYAFSILDESEFTTNEQFRGAGSIEQNAPHRIMKYARSFSGSVRSSSTQNDANFIVYRLADLYLMKAEAYSQKESPDFVKAQEYLNLIRFRVDQPLLNLAENAETFEDAILEERAKELAFEGKRWFDLLRMGRRNNYARKDKLVEILVQDVNPSQRLVQMAKLSNPLGWYMPIHDSEIERNPNISQNPYYDYEN